MKECPGCVGNGFVMLTASECDAAMAKAATEGKS